MGSRFSGYTDTVKLFLFLLSARSRCRCQRVKFLPLPLYGHKFHFVMSFTAVALLPRERQNLIIRHYAFASTSAEKKQKTQK